MIKEIKRELRVDSYTDQDKGDISDMFEAQERHVLVQHWTSQELLEWFI